MKLTQEGPSPCPHASCETKLNLESQQLLLDHMFHTVRRKKEFLGAIIVLFPVSALSCCCFFACGYFCLANIWSMDDIGQRDYIMYNFQ